MVRILASKGLTRPEVAIKLNVSKSVIAGVAYRNKIRFPMSNRGPVKPWTDKEFELIKRKEAMKLSYTTLGKMLNRSFHSVASKVGRERNKGTLNV